MKKDTISEGLWISMGLIVATVLLVAVGLIFAETQDTIIEEVKRYENY